MHEAIGRSGNCIVSDSACCFQIRGKLSHDPTNALYHLSTKPTLILNIELTNRLCLSYMKSYLHAGKEVVQQCSTRWFCKCPLGQQITFGGSAGHGSPG